MVIPDYQTIMLPILNYLGSGESRASADIVNHVSDLYKLTEEERNQLVPSGHMGLIKNRVSWAGHYMKRAGLLEQPQRAHFKITKRGSEVLGQKPATIDNRYLRGFKEFLEFNRPSVDQSKVNEEFDSNLTPRETIEEAYQAINEELSDEILETIRNCSPQFFERLVLDLLLAMGYGNKYENASFLRGRSGDAGVDGVINQDALGLDVIYVQAKKYKQENKITPHQVRDFIGSLMSENCGKGVFITTSSFTQDSINHLKTSKAACNVVPIDGIKLAQLMIEHNVGVSKVTSYELKKIDSDYFVEG